MDSVLDMFDDVCWSIGDGDFSTLRYSKRHLCSSGSDKTLCGVVIPQYPANDLSMGDCKKCRRIAENSRNPKIISNLD